VDAADRSTDLAPLLPTSAERSVDAKRLAVSPSTDLTDLTDLKRG